MTQFKIVEVTPNNVNREGLFCMKNPLHPGFLLKVAWLNARTKEGLKLKILKRENEPIGFVEYVPAEFAWRPVSADHYLFIQCLWVYPRKNLGQGFGSMLLKEVEKDAIDQGKYGIAVVTSNGAWMSKPPIFLKNDYKEIAKKERFILMAKKLVPAPNPEFIDWTKNIKQFKGLHLVYADQCPLFIKSVEEIPQTAKNYGLEMTVTKLESAAQVRESATGYGVYSLIYNGKLLADHYISNTRFQNILRKELKIK